MSESPHFPQEFPSESIRTLADIIFNGELATRPREFGLHAYWVEGYGLNLALPENSTLSISALSADDADAVCRLEGALQGIVFPQGFFDDRPILRRLLEVGIPLAIEFIKKKYGL